MNSLRHRLTLLLLMSGVLLMGIAGALLYWRISDALTDEFDGSLRLTAQSLQAFVEEKNHTIRMESEVDDLPQFQRKGGSAVYLLRHSEGKEIRRSRSLGEASLPARKRSDKSAEFFDTKLSDGRKLRCISLRVLARIDDDDEERRTDSRAQEAFLIVGRQRNVLDHTLEELRNALLLVGGITLTSLLALVAWSVRRGLKPLDQLAEDVARVNEDSLDTRFKEQSLPTELQPIAGRLNRLLSHLEAAFAREKRFTADAAHELRTPLAELRTLAEVNLMAPPESPAENAASWQDVRDSAIRMESLALKLLELARSVQSERNTSHEPVALSTLLDTAWQQVERQSNERGITLQKQFDDALTLQSDPILLGLIVANLTGNAVQHAMANSTLLVSGDAHALRFANRTDELTEADLPQLFERFWKKDESRSDGRRHGLGLAIAKETAELLGGSLEARLLEGNLLEITLRVP